MQTSFYRQCAIIVVALLVPILPFAIIGELPGDRWLSARDDAALSFAAAGSLVLMLDIVLPMPSSIVGTLMGGRLGFWGGFGATWLGLTIGHMLGYLLGRFIFTRVDAKFAEAPTLLVVFLSRPVPIFSEAMAVAAGAGKISFLPFVMAASSGNLVYSAVLAGNGAALLPDAYYAVSLLVPMLLPAIAWLIWRRTTKSRTDSQQST